MIHKDLKFESLISIVREEVFQGNFHQWELWGLDEYGLSGSLIQPQMVTLRWRTLRSKHLWWAGDDERSTRAMRVSVVSGVSLSRCLLLTISTRQRWVGSILEWDDRSFACPCGLVYAPGLPVHARVALSLLVRGAGIGQVRPPPAYLAEELRLVMQRSPESDMATPLLHIWTEVDD